MDSESRGAVALTPPVWLLVEKKNREHSVNSDNINQFAYESATKKIRQSPES